MSEDPAHYHRANDPTLFEVFIAGDPKAQPRPRAFVRGGKVSVYDPATAEGWKNAIAVACQPLAQAQLTGALSLQLEFYHKRPASHLRANGRELKPSAPAWHCHKPDVDNLAKAVLDALTAIGVWHDDRQVTQLCVARYWADPPEPSGCLLSLIQLQPQLQPQLSPTP